MEEVNSSQESVGSNPCKISLVPLRELQEVNWSEDPSSDDEGGLNQLVTKEDPPEPPRTPSRLVCLPVISLNNPNQQNIWISPIRGQAQGQGLSPSPGKSGKRKAKATPKGTGVKRGRPCAENSGMKTGALLPFMVSKKQFGPNANVKYEGESPSPTSREQRGMAVLQELQPQNQNIIPDVNEERGSAAPPAPAPTCVRNLSFPSPGPRPSPSREVPAENAPAAASNVGESFNEKLINFPVPANINDEPNGCRAVPSFNSANVTEPYPEVENGNEEQDTSSLVTEGTDQGRPDTATVTLALPTTQPQPGRVNIEESSNLELERKFNKSKRKASLDAGATCEDTSPSTSDSNRSRGKRPRKQVVSWTNTITEWDADLGRNKFPNPQDIAKAFSEGILGTIRLAHPIRVVISDFMSNYLAACRRNEEKQPELLSTLTFASESQSSAFQVVAEILSLLKSQAKLQSTQKFPLRFLQDLTNLVTSNYHEYVKKPVKLSYPLLIQIFGFTCGGNWNIVKTNFQTIVNELFQLMSNEELNICLKWIEISFGFFKKYYHLTDKGAEKKDSELVECFVNKARRQPDLGVRVLRNIEDSYFGSSVCFKLILTKVPELAMYDLQNQRTFLENVAEFFAISEDKACPPRDIPNKCNPKGESDLHICCHSDDYSVKKKKKLNIQTVLSNLRESDKDINAVDYSGNTALHDAGLHGSYEEMKLLFEGFYNPFEEVGKMNINLFARNKDGNTALHLAVQESKFNCVRLLVQKCEEGGQENLRKLLQTRNEDRCSILDMVRTSDRDIRLFLEEKDAKGILNLDIQKEFFGQIHLSSASAGARCIREERCLQDLIAYWKDFENRLAHS